MLGRVERVELFEAVACDRIEISLSPTQEERLISVAIPNLITDLPVYVVWAEDPSKKGPPPEIMKGVTRFIFDSEASDNLKTFATALLSVQKSDITDLKEALNRNGIDLIAEKVEVEPVVVGLLEYEVDYGQGWLFGEPKRSRDDI